MIPIEAPLLEALDFNAVPFTDMDHEMYHFESGDPGDQAVVRLANGMYLSIVRHRLSYGGDRGQFEIMVFDEMNPDGLAVPGITDEDGIIGYLEPRDVTDTLIKLAGA
jgi:hypothetical protein